MTTAALDAFWADLLATVPPLARVLTTAVADLPPVAGETGFRIVPSRRTPGARTLIPPDVATCADCLADLDLVLIENVGNLVCPAEFDVGEHHKAMVFSITEGEDKPLKYPVMFRAVEAVAINKIDLAPYLDFDRALFLRNLRQVNPTVTTFELSARTGEGVDAWVDWVARHHGRASRG